MEMEYQWQRDGKHDGKTHRIYYTGEDKWQQQWLHLTLWKGVFATQVLPTSVNKHKKETQTDKQINKL